MPRVVFNYKMRAVDSGRPAPGYIYWVADFPDYDATLVATATPPLIGSVVSGSPIVLSNWSTTAPNINSSESFWQDDFEEFGVASPLTITTVPTFFNTGRGNWGSVALISNGSISVRDGEDGRPGIIRMTTGASNNSILRLYKGNLQTTRWSLGKNFKIYEISVRLLSISSSQLFVGMLDAAAGNSQLLLYYSSAINVNYMAYAQKAGVDTGTNTSVGKLADTNWHKFKLIQSKLGTMEYYIDDVLVKTYTTNIPNTEGLNWTCDLYTIAGGAQSCDVDFAAYESQTLDR